ncbi:MAG: helix-turn-helix domain-containing protein [Gemmatimonadales bacterium]
MGREPTPTIRRWQLGQELRRHREAAKVTPREAAAEIEVSQATLSKIETGRQQVKPLYVKHLARHYDLGYEVRDELLDLVDAANQPEWFASLAKYVPNWFRQYLGYEAAASVIRTYHAELVDGLLQTPEYVRAVALVNRPDASDIALDKAVALRRGRQERVADGNGPVIHSVLNEAVLRRAVGGRAVMRDQLMRLVKLSELPNVTIQVLPFSIDAHPAMTSPFTLLGFAEPWQRMSTVYLESGRGALYLEGKADLDRYGWMFTELTTLALDPKDTHDLLVTVAGDL